MLSICQRKKHRYYRRAFVMWLSFSKRKELLQKYDILNEIVTQTMFKQKCFLALKHACNEQRAERSNMKFKAWSSWCETARKQRYFEKKEIMVSRIEGLRT